jgi:hypothetical protein
MGRRNTRSKYTCRILKGQIRSRRLNSKGTKPCLGLIAQDSGSWLKNYGLNQLKRVLRRPSEPAEVVGESTF